MSRPDGIPQDVWDIACECFANAAGRHIVASQIVAERQRCAAVCRKAATYYDAGAGWAHSREAIHVAQAQCRWLASEIEHPTTTRVQALTPNLPKQPPEAIAEQRD